MDYTELVKSLRICTSDKRGYGCASECSYGKSHPLNHWCMDYLLTDAADAIEELDTLLDGLEADNDALCETIERLKKPRWIPVTERLPENGQSCLCYYVGGEHRQLSWYSIDTFYECDSLTGFYPHLKDSVGGAATHWMPLPEPPKEET